MSISVSCVYFLAIFQLECFLINGIYRNQITTCIYFIIAINIKQKWLEFLGSMERKESSKKKKSDFLAPLMKSIQFLYSVRRSNKILLYFIRR